jgi:acetyl-CoA carboxylase carboxyltransferase component
MITANDPSVKGGASNPWTVQEDLPGLPDRRGEPAPARCALVESGGADLPPRRRSSSRAAGCSATSPARPRQGPTIALVFGNSTAGGAYVPGMSDYT